VLSGGERNRLALCKLLLQPINVSWMSLRITLTLNQKCLENCFENTEGTLLLVLTTGFSSGNVNIVYEFRDQKIKEFR
jgi:ATP-binding cassette subfamily F protein 3